MKLFQEFFSLSYILYMQILYIYLFHDNDRLKEQNYVHDFYHRYDIYIVDVLYKIDLIIN